MLRKIDRQMLRLARTRGHTPTLDSSARLLAQSAEFGAIWQAALLGGALLAPQERRQMWLTGSATVLSAGLGNGALKMIARRARPMIDDLPAITRMPSSFSFPSGHAATAAAGAVALSRLAPAGRPVWSLLALAVAGTRPYLGVHYPSDVLVGLASGVLLEELSRRLLSRWSEAPPTGPEHVPAVARETL